MKSIYYTFLSLIVFILANNKIFTLENPTDLPQTTIKNTEDITNERKAAKKITQFIQKCSELIGDKKFNKVSIYPFLEYKLSNIGDQSTIHKKYPMLLDKNVQKIIRSIRNSCKFTIIEYREYYEGCMSIIGRFAGKEIFSLYTDPDIDAELNLIYLNSIIGHNNIQHTQNIIYKLLKSMKSKNKVNQKEELENLIEGLITYINKTHDYRSTGFLKNLDDIKVNTITQENSVYLTLFNQETNEEIKVNFIKINNNLNDIFQYENITEKDVVEFYNKKNPRYCLKIVWNNKTNFNDKLGIFFLIN